jgi:hypothetical protein
MNEATKWIEGGKINLQSKYLNRPMTRLAGTRILLCMYRHINRVVYGGRLPVRPTLKWETLPNDYAQTHVIDFVRGGKQRQRIEFYFSKGSCRSIKAAARELVHEVVHVAHQDMPHGDDFEDEMLRIRRAVFAEQLW